MRTTKTVLRCEALEDRITPAILLVAGNLYISGTPHSDVVTVNIWDNAGTKYYRVVENFTSKDFRVSSVTGGEVHFQGGYGDDSFVNYANLRTVAFGGPGNDRLVAGSGNDALDGGVGNDVLLGG